MTERKRVALVTGGMGGIGTAISQRLYRDGFTVVIGSNPYSERKNPWMAKQLAAGFDFHCVDFDITDWESTRQGFERVAHNIGAVDVLINNAGITREVAFQNMTPENWREVIDTDLTGLFNTTRQVIGQMLANGWGRIINISSINGQQGHVNQTHYSAAKAGVHGFSMALALEVADRGVTVNTVSPGFIRSGATIASGTQAVERLIAQAPMGRLGKPEEVAALVSWLASDQASYTTGADFSVNGGTNMR